MKELKAKHLAPYLPYNLQVEYKGKVTTLDALDSRGWVFIGENRMVSFVNPKYIKPILRPLVSMTWSEATLINSIISNHVCFHVKEDGSMGFLSTSITPVFESAPIQSEDIATVYEWLFFNHFDVFRLIDKGLAVEK